MDKGPCSDKLLALEVKEVSNQESVCQIIPPASPDYSYFNYHQLSEGSQGDLVKNL